MSSVTLLLGPILFRNFEVPASINVGGAQRLVIHRLPGGNRVIDALGRDDADISFSGVFSGPDATLRARLIDEMRVLGLPIPLTWDIFFYSVIIKRFDADYRSGWWVAYRITCTVVCDEAAGLAASGISLADDMLSDVSIASTFAAAAGIDLADTQSAVSVPGAAVKGSAVYSAALVSLTAAGAVIGSRITMVEATLGDAAWHVDGQIAGVASTLSSLALAAQQISSLQVSQAYIRRVSVNLSNAST